LAKTTKLYLLILPVIFLLSACSDERDKVAEGEHIWKEQTQALEKAQAVDQMVQDAHAQQRQLIDEQTK